MIEVECPECNKIVKFETKLGLEIFDHLGRCPSCEYNYELCMDAWREEMRRFANE